MARYNLSARRRQSILRAQRISAQRRHMRRRNPRGGIIGRVLLTQSLNLATLGTSGKIIDFADRQKGKARKRKKQAKLDRKRRGY